MQLTTMTYAVTGKIARITLNRPERSNALTFETPRELAECVERANLDPAVHVIALAGAGAGFCGGYDLRIGAEDIMRFGAEHTSYPKGSPYDPEARYARKETTTWVGYNVHLTETCDDGAPHLITHVETTPGPTAARPCRVITTCSLA